MKKALSLILAVALTLTLAPAAQAYSDAYGQEVWLQETQLHDGVTLSDNIYWSDYYSDLRHEYYITYTPGETVTAAAAYGTSVCERITASAAAQAYEAEGYRVVGAINGDFYDTATGYPLGLLVSEGDPLRLLQLLRGGLPLRWLRCHGQPQPPDYPHHRGPDAVPGRHQQAPGGERRRDPPDL